jgi:hypothetical protein
VQSKFEEKAGIIHGVWGQVGGRFEFGRHDEREYREEIV